MEFCPKCGAILMMKTTRVGCPKCSYVAKGKVCMEMKEDIENEDCGLRVSTGKEASINPITDWDCECGHKKAEFWIRQMRSGDEPESRFYKCCKCGKTCRVD